MENSVIKAKMNMGLWTSKPISLGKKIAEVDILRRAYEIYMENGNTFSNEIDELFRDEIETGKPENLKSSAVIPGLNIRSLQF
jgi:hypothetical protein